MKIIKDLQKHVSGVKDQLAAIRIQIADINNQISQLEGAPFDQTETLSILSSMVDAGASRYLDWLRTHGITKLTDYGCVSNLARQINEKDAMDALFIKIGGRGENMFNHDALCFFFGAMMKEQFAVACADYAPALDSGMQCGSSMTQRLQEIATAQSTLKELELQEEEVESALHEARVQIEALSRL